MSHIRKICVHRHIRIETGNSIGAGLPSFLSLFFFFVRCVSSGLLLLIVRV
ncbi:hypothetical protein YC2023_051194 [Brassica napus]